MANEDFITKAQLNEAIARLESKLMKDVDSRLVASDGRISKLAQSSDTSHKTIVEMEQLLPKIKQVVEPSEDVAPGAESKDDIDSIKTQLSDSVSKIDIMEGDMLTAGARIGKLEDDLSAIVSSGVIDASLIEVTNIDFATMK